MSTQLHTRHRIFAVLLIMIAKSELSLASPAPKVAEPKPMSVTAPVDWVVRTRSSGLSRDPDAARIRKDTELFLAWRRSSASEPSSKKKKRTTGRLPAQSSAGHFEASCSESDIQKTPVAFCELAAQLKRDPQLDRRAEALLAAIEKGALSRTPAQDQFSQGSDANDFSDITPLGGADDSPSDNLAHLGVPVLSVRPPEKAELEAWLSGNDPARFAGLTELKPLARALRRFNEWPKLSGIVSASLQARSCPNSHLLAGLGMKAEEFLPDETARKDALRLYTRAAECSTDQLARPKSERDSKKQSSVFLDAADPGLRAHFRASLLHLWNEDCDRAEKHLFTLTDGPSNPYVARALYWRAWCAKKTGNKLLQASLRGRVFRDHPLTVQGLVLGAQSKDPDLISLQDILGGPVPVARFRSDASPALNHYIRAAEALLEKGERELASKMLDRILRRIDETEPEFRIYLAVLLSRVDDRIAQFKALSAAFKAEPATLSRATLELFYPLHRYEILEKHKGRLDPLLAAALIRQESGFNERARSPAGAMGLMQLMPATARRLERVSRQELFDPRTNVRLGVKYFSKLLDRFGGDAELALAGYNAGPERVDQWLKRYPVSSRALFVDLIPFRETRDYVSFIARNYYWYQALYGARATPGRVTQLDQSKVLEKSGQWFPLFKNL
jgi:soluble lytic murein transglycosylase-like protein